MNLWNAVFLLCTISILTFGTALKTKQAEAGQAAPQAAGQAANQGATAAGQAANQGAAAAGPAANNARQAAQNRNPNPNPNANPNANPAPNNRLGNRRLNNVSNPNTPPRANPNSLPRNPLNEAQKLVGSRNRRNQKHTFEKHRKILRYYRIIGVNKKVPTIGVLCGPQPIDTHMKVRQAKCDHHTIHWLYQSGAEIVPILPWLKDHELDHVLSKVHGVLFPGGKRKLKTNHQNKHSFENFAKILFLKLKVKDMFN